MIVAALAAVALQRAVAGCRANELPVATVGEWLTLADGADAGSRLVVQTTRAVSDSAQTGGLGLPGMAFDIQEEPP